MDRIVRRGGVLAMLALFAISQAPTVRGQEQASIHHHPFIGPNGGIVEDVGPYNGELLVRGMDVSLFLRDHNGRSVDVTGLKANVVVLTGTVRRGSFALSAASRNQLTGSGPHPGGNLRAIVTLIMPDGRTDQAGYRLHSGSR